MKSKTHWSSGKKKRNQTWVTGWTSTGVAPRIQKPHKDTRISRSITRDSACVDQQWRQSLARVHGHSGPRHQTMPPMPQRQTYPRLMELDRSPHRTLALGHGPVCQLWCSLITQKVNAYCTWLHWFSVRFIFYGSSFCLDKPSPFEKQSQVLLCAKR